MSFFFARRSHRLLVRMPASEIDDIFSGLVKKPSGALQAGPSSSNSRPLLNDQSSSKKKKAKKRKRETDATEPIQSTKEASGSVKPPSAAEVAETKSRSKKLKKVVETVVDPSVIAESSKGSSLPRKADVKIKSNPKVKKADKDDKDHLERFKDSRGTGPSAFSSFTPGMGSDDDHFTGRKTEEGFMIYKEDELGIRDEGGGESQ